MLVQDICSGSKQANNQRYFKRRRLAPFLFAFKCFFWYNKRNEIVLNIRFKDERKTKELFDCSNINYIK